MKTIFVVLLAGSCALVAQGFQARPLRPPSRSLRRRVSSTNHQHTRHHGLIPSSRKSRLLVAPAQSDDDGKPKRRKIYANYTGTPRKKKGYQFGDITRGILGRVTEQAKQVTGKDTYQFGDLTKWADQTAKEKAANMTGKANYEFGDLTKAIVSNYTGKANYTVGDISQELIRRIQTGEYSTEDVWLGLRILLSVSFSAFSPVASILPVRLLLNLVNMGLGQEVSGRLLGVLAETLDKRMKEVFTGSASYAVGDITKDRLKKSLAEFTGKESYEIGDLSRTIAKMSAAEADGSKTSSKKKIKVQDGILNKLDMWDEQKGTAKS